MSNRKPWEPLCWCLRLFGGRGEVQSKKWLSRPFCPLFPDSWAFFMDFSAEPHFQPPCPFSSQVLWDLSLKVERSIVSVLGRAEKLQNAINRQMKQSCKPRGYLLLHLGLSGKCESFLCPRMMDYSVQEADLALSVLTFSALHPPSRQCFLKHRHHITFSSCCSFSCAEEHFPCSVVCVASLWFFGWFDGSLILPSCLA